MTGSANVIPDRHRRMGRIRGAILAKCFVLILVLLRNIASHAQRLEGSRFVVWQFYRLAAGGSRE
jgi:hypothetical protein